MKIKIDENLPASLADALADLGHDADTVPREAPGGRGMNRTRRRRREVS